MGPTYSFQIRRRMADLWLFVIVSLLCVMVDKGFLLHLTRLSEKDGF